MTKRFGVVVAVLLAVFACACGQNPAPSQTGEPGAIATRVIGASLLTQRHQFYRDLVAALEEEAPKHGLTLRIQYAEFDGQKQINQIETFVRQGVDAIIVSPKDSAGITPAVNDARAKGIPVFTADIAAQNADVVCHVASDNVQGGRILGEYLGKLLGGKGKVAIIDNPEVTSVQDRTRGFEEALAKFPEMAIVQRAPGGGVRDKAMAAAQNVLQANPGLNAIFGINDDSALGALAAVESAGLQDTITIVGYDGTPEAREAILAGKALKADTVQFPREIGKKTIETIAAFLAGEDVPKVVPVEVGIIDKASLEAEQGK